MTLNDVFSASGLLKQKFPQYTIREGQVAMANLVQQSIIDKKSAVIEGSTGVGKGFGYLIPIILSGKGAIVSTSNKSLQDQLNNKDLPVLQDVLQTSVSWTVLKGKNNYFCHEHFDTNKVDIAKELESMGHNAEFMYGEIAKWAKEEKIGDIEYCALDLNPKIREMITCSNTTTHKVGSEGYKFCFASRARARAQESQIILVNHTILALDISLRNETEGKAGILPRKDLVVIDEAHEFERAAVLAFSDEISKASLKHFLNWTVVKSALHHIDKDKDKNEKLADLLEQMMDAVLVKYLPKKGEKYYEQLKVPYFTGLDGLRQGIGRVVAILKNYKSFDESADAKLQEVIKEGQNLSMRLLEISAPDDNFLRWSEAKDFKGHPIVKLKSVPLDISYMLKKGLFEGRTVICTSATLSVYNSFDYFKQQIGMPNDCYELIVPSPFDYKKQALIYIPSGESGTVEPIHEIEELLKLSKGRAFVLFTSYHDMDRCYQYVQTEYPKIVQGQDGMTRAKVLELFKETPNAVLFATKSFWEGVDIVGEKLSLVIIHKVPFENPYDLVFSSKCEKIDEKAGKKVSFFRLAVPDACIKLKQGVGRLIRSSSDKGVIALLDSRVMFKPYGKVVLESMPPAYRTQQLEKVKAFFERD